jgi:anti-sigma factor RsiW
MSDETLGVRAVSTEPDRYLEWDGAYVLGALSPSERREYERHLAGCPSCQRAVSQLAGMPGLLAQVAAEDAAMLTGSGGAGDEVSPPELMGVITTRIIRRRRRVLIAVGSIAAALVLVLGGLGVLVGRGIVPIGPQSTYRVAFTPVVQSGITANVDVTPGSSETGLQLECQYAQAQTGEYTSEVAIWVRQRSGDDVEVFSWFAKPNKVMRPKATAGIATWRIDQIELRDARTGELLSTAPVR